MQLEFTDGFKTPMMQTGHSSKKNYGVQTIELDVTKRIAKISMAIWNSQKVLGIRMYDDEGNYIVNVKFERGYEGEWVE